MLIAFQITLILIMFVCAISAVSDRNDIKQTSVQVIVSFVSMGVLFATFYL